MLQRDTARSRELSLTVCSVSNVAEDRTCEVDWVASGPARGRVKLVDQPNAEWLDEIHTADSMYPTSCNV
jgi:hypothetical protein